MESNTSTHPRSFGSLDIVPFGMTDSCNGDTEIYQDEGYTDLLGKRDHNDNQLSSEKLRDAYYGFPSKQKQGSESSTEEPSMMDSFEPEIDNPSSDFATNDLLLGIMKGKMPAHGILSEEEFKTASIANSLVKSLKTRADSQYKAVLSTLKKFMMRDIKQQNKKYKSTNPIYYHHTVKIRKEILSKIIGPVSEELCESIWDISKGPTRDWQDLCTRNGTDMSYLEHLIQLLQRKDRPIQTLYFEEKIVKCIEDLIDLAMEEKETSSASLHSLIQAKLDPHKNQKAKTKFPMTVEQFEDAVQVTVRKLQSVVRDYRSE